jgi:hypothetical protein
LTLNSTGKISLGGLVAGESVNLELGNGPGTSISMNNTVVRTLAGISSGPITLPTDFYGKSLAFVYNPTIASDTANYDMYADAVAAGWNQTAPLNMTVTVNSGVNIYSNSVGSYSFSTNTGFPTGTTLTLINYGNIVGRGGDGGTGGGVRTAGYGGGSAGPGLYAGYTITVYNYGAISGGGGGGGGGGAG